MDGFGGARGSLELPDILSMDAPDEFLPVSRKQARWPAKPR